MMATAIEMIQVQRLGLANIPLQSLDRDETTDSGSNIRSPLLIKSPSLPTISPVMNLHGWQKIFEKNRQAGISQWRK